MITVEEAINKVRENSIITEYSEQVELIKSLDSVLAESVLSPIDMPPFRQSAMDGYAVNFSESISNYLLVDEIAAGSSKNTVLKAGEAVRIFTGAAVPDDANTVVKQEIAKSEGRGLSFTEGVGIGENIRPKGEQILAGTIALEKGAVMTPSAIGYLAGLGITEVSVIKKPKVHIIATGNELVQPGNELGYGKVFESNTIMLATALVERGFSNLEVIRIEDDKDSTLKTVNDSLKKADFILISGGISVGDYDFVGDALLENGVNQIFYKVKQKPGKPLFYGVKDKTQIFALPGNPAAAMTGFYIYVLPALRKFAGKGFQELNKRKFRLSGTFHKNGDRAQFLKAKTNGDQIEILEAQSSSMLSSFAKADALVYIATDKYEINDGEEVMAYLL